MKFQELDCCPFCGHDEFYTKEYVYGSIKCAERFDGEEAHNEELYDYLNTKNYNGKAYCRRCNKYIGNRESNVLSKQAQKALDHPTEKGGAK